jgi:hypothetical protein
MARKIKPKTEEKKIEFPKTIEVDFKCKIQYNEDGSINFDYEDNELLRLCGMAVCNDVLRRRLEISKQAPKKHPAHLESNHRANITGAIHLIDNTLKTYLIKVFQNTFMK